MLVVGCGGLGATAVSLLARAGVGALIVVDRDLVERSNLQRQLLYEEADADAGLPKAVAAARAVARINREVAVDARAIDVGPDDVAELVARADLVVDGTDNLETRFLVNDACIARGVPWIYGGAVGSTGMVMAIVPGTTACLRCLYPTPAPAGTVATCDTAGVLGSTVVAVAAAQVAAALKLLVGDREGAGELAAFDVWTQEHERTAVPRRPDCPCCVGRRFEYLQATLTSRSTLLCGGDAVQVRPASRGAIDLHRLAERLAAAGTVSVVTDAVVRFGVDGHEITVFADGRAIVKGTGDPTVARTLYARYVGA